MSLTTEIATSYEDFNGLVSSKKCHESDVNPTGNGVMYTGELMTLLNLRDELTDYDKQYFMDTMKKCMPVTGLLVRGPGWNETDPDDYYGFCAGVVATGETTLAEAVLTYGWLRFGSFNGADPTKWTPGTFLWRQPQMVFALYAAANRRTAWLWPLEIITALIIALSCISATSTNQDEWRISWLLIQATKNFSWLCKAASWFWYKRIFRVFGHGGLAVPYSHYYEEGHPFVKYFPVAKQ